MLKLITEVNLDHLMWTAVSGTQLENHGAAEGPGAGSPSRAGYRTHKWKRSGEGLRAPLIHGVYESKTDKQNNTEDRLVDSRGEGEGAGDGQNGRRGVKCMGWKVADLRWSSFAACADVGYNAALYVTKTEPPSTTSSLRYLQTWG